jgi:hypothetical protein
VLLRILFEKTKNLNQITFNQLSNSFIDSNENNCYSSLLVLTKYLSSSFIEHQTKRAIVAPVLTTDIIEADIIKIIDDDDDDEIIKPMKKKKQNLNDEEKAGIRKLDYLFNKIVECQESIEKYNNKNVSLRQAGSIDSTALKCSEKQKLIVDHMKRFLKVGRRYPQLIQKNSVYRKFFNNIEQGIELEPKSFYSLDPARELTLNKRLDEEIIKFCKNLKQTPNLNDIEKIIIKANKELNLGLEIEKCREYAFSLLEKLIVGTKVKREQYDNQILFGSLDQEDPSLFDENLKSILDKNASECNKQLSNILKEYVKIENEENFVERNSKRICRSSSSDVIIID